MTTTHDDWWWDCLLLCFPYLLLLLMEIGGETGSWVRVCAGCAGVSIGGESGSCVCVCVCAGAGISLQQLQQQTTTNNDNKKKKSYSPSDDNRKRIAKERSRNVQEDLMTGGGARKKECCCALGCATEGKGRRVAHAINVPRTCLVLVGPPSTVRRLWIPPNPPFSSSSSSYAWSRKAGTPKTWLQRKKKKKKSPLYLCLSLPLPKNLARVLQLLQESCSWSVCIFSNNAWMVLYQQSFLIMLGCCTNPSSHARILQLMIIWVCLLQQCLNGGVLILLLMS